MRDQQGPADEGASLPARGARPGGGGIDPVATIVRFDHFLSSKKDSIEIT
jgi:hypothetical protein